MNDSHQTGAGLARLRARFGPGLIFAAAAVGTSHIVQSTRAGAGYGLTLGLLILLVCLLKYPLFRFAADYAAATGENLVRGYGRRGRLLVLVMFITSAIEAVAAMAGTESSLGNLGAFYDTIREDFWGPEAAARVAVWGVPMVVLSIISAVSQPAPR